MGLPAHSNSLVHIRLAEASTDKELAFGVQVRKALKKWELATDYTIDQYQIQLRDYRKEVLAALNGTNTDWGAHRLKQLEEALEAARMSATRKMAGSWRVQATRATALAMAGVDDPLMALGVAANMVPTMIPVQQLAVINGYVPDLIVGVTGDIHKKVRHIMRQSLLGETQPTNIAEIIGNIVGPLKGNPKTSGVFGTAAKRGRTILRTEMNRIHNLVKTQRVGDVAQHYPGVGYKWLHRPSMTPRAAHSKLDGKIIFPAKNEKFQVGLFKAAGPHDPHLPAEHTINCHCTAVVVYDETDAPAIGGEIKLATQAPIKAVAKVKPKPVVKPLNNYLTPDQLAASPVAKSSHAAGVKAAAGKQGKAAAAAYDASYRAQAMAKAVDAGHAAKKALPPGSGGTQLDLAYHKAKTKVFIETGLEDYKLLELKKVANFEAKVSAADAAAAKQATKELEDKAADMVSAFSGASDAPAAVTKFTDSFLSGDLKVLMKTDPAAAKKLAKSAEAAHQKLKNAAMKKLAEIEAQQVAAAKAEYEALHAGKQWVKQDLYHNADHVLPKMPVDKMGQIDKELYYRNKQAQLVQAKANQIKIQGADALYVQDLEYQIQAAARALAEAEGDLARFAGRIKGLDLSQAELDYLMTLTKTKQNAWLKLKTTGQAPAIGPGAARGVAADWESGGGRVQLNFGDGEKYKATKYWRKMPFDDSRYPAKYHSGARSYQGSSYSWINEPLRNGQAPRSAATRRAQQHLDALMDLNSLPDDLIVHRGIGSDAMEILGVPWADAEKVVGTVLKDGGYCSTAIGKDARWSKSIVAEIYVPKGNKYIHYNWTASHQGEIEILLPRGTQFFVHKIERSSGRIKLFLEVIAS